MRSCLSWCCLGLCLASCTPQPPSSQRAPQPSRRSSEGVDNLVGFLGGLAEDVGLANENVHQALELRDRRSQTRIVVASLQKCFANGLGSEACTKGVVGGACALVGDYVLKETSPGFGMFGLPFDKLCAGEPTLKCCKYDPETEVGCHSAFNSEAPINCEGNWTFPHPEAYGSCRDLPTGGCDCCYLAECGGAGTGCNPSAISAPFAPAWRVDNFVKDLAKSFARAADADPDGAADFAMLMGCTAHREALLTLPPFAMPDSVPATPDPGPDFHVSDNDPAARYDRGLMTMAVRRVLGGIPNGVARWEAISARVYTAEEIAAAVAPVGDPDALLGRLLGPFGLQVLQGADARYQLLAVPLPDEPEGANDWPYVAGCTPGTPASLDMYLSTAGNAVTVQLSVQDPLAGDTPSGEYPAAVDFGDGQMQPVFLLSPPQPIAHAYAAAGTYAVRAYLWNSAGLVSTADGTAVAGTPETPPALPPPAVTSVALDLTAASYSFQPPWFDVSAGAVDLAGNTAALGHLYTQAAPRPGNFADDLAAFSGALPNLAPAPIGALQLTARVGGGVAVNLTGLRLKQVRFTNWDGSITAFAPTPDDVQWTPAGAAYPVAPVIDSASGALMLPAGGELVTVRRPASDAAFAGCRPSYAPATPLMATGRGGCEDLATTLAWSLLGPAPLTYAQAVAYCAGLSQGGVSGWRLPNDNELRAVIGDGKSGTFFAFTTNNVYAWTSTPWTSGTRDIRNLSAGNSGIISDTATAAVLCVR